MVNVIRYSLSAVEYDFLILSAKPTSLTKSVKNKSNSKKILNLVKEGRRKRVANQE